MVLRGQNDQRGNVLLPRGGAGIGPGHSSRKERVSTELWVLYRGSILADPVFALIFHSINVSIQFYWLLKSINFYKINNFSKMKVEFFFRGGGVSSVQVKLLSIN